MVVHLRALWHGSSLLLFGLHLALAVPAAAGQLSPTDTTEQAEASACHAFVDYENIWTIELIRSREENITPILNIVTFTRGEWDLRPDQIRIFNREGKEARIKRFALDTGVPGDAYKSNYLKVLGNSFVGVDLEGKLKDFPTSPRVTIDLAHYRFELQPLDCEAFDNLAGRINKINFNSPDIREDFDLIKIPHLGRRLPRPKPHEW